MVEYVEIIFVTLPPLRLGHLYHVDTNIYDTKSNSRYTQCLLLQLIILMMQTPED